MACDTLTHHPDLDRPWPLNPELAWRVRDVIVQHPEHHDQRAWLYLGRDVSGDALLGADDVLASCGTTACAAGWTVLLAGYRVDNNGFIYDANGVRTGHYISELAQELLGLTWNERTLLFHSDNDDPVPGRIEEIFGPDPRMPVS